MLILLNTGWVAHKCGKWRGGLYLAAALVLSSIAWAVSEIAGVIATRGQPQPGDSPLAWFCVALMAGAGLLLLYGAWLVYIDETRRAYVDVAERYRRDGW
jgi:hypothetical protein